jgi:polar amino acid transport system substrate-binding protein
MDTSMNKRTLLAVAGGLLCVTALTACSSGAGAATPSSSKVTDAAAAKLVPSSIAKRGTISVAMDATYAPFETVSESSNKIVGIDADLSNAIGKELGLKVNLVNIGFDTIIASLQAGKYDAAASAISITPARESVVDFVSYLSAGSGLAVAKGNPHHLSMNPLKLCGQNIGAPRGTIQAISQLPAISQKCTAAGKKPVTISQFPSQTATNLAVSSGRIAAAMAASISLAQQVKGSNGELALAPGKDYDPTPIGIAFPKGSKLVPAVKAAVAEIAKSGRLATIVTKWGLPASAISTKN